MNGSLRWRLFVWLSASIVVMSAATAALSFAMNFRDANDLQDTQLEQVAAVLARQPALAPLAHFEPRDGEDAETHFVARELGSRAVDPNPKIDVFLPDSLPPGLQSIAAAGVHWRVMVTRNLGGQRFAVAQRQTVRDEVARDSAVLTLVPMLVLVPVLLLILNLVLRQGFARLVALSREVDQVDGNHLATLDASQVPREALSLVQAVNRLLDRLGLVLEQQRRMVADAAHELRTPIAATRVQADNLAHAELPQEARTRLDTLQRGLARISELIEQLLRLARVQGTAPAVDQRVRFDALVRNVIEEILPLAQAGDIDLGCLRLDVVELRGDALHMQALVRNAIDNAVKYTPAGGAVDVSVEVVAGIAAFTVQDTGPGIDASLHGRVFEPFFRILGSRQLGSGLGLAIVRSAAAALGGEVELAARRDGRSGLRFVYRQETS